jgi:hypothetical protein
VCPREGVQAALKAILAATEFARSESLSRLLEHLVTNALDGRAEDLKEYNLGSDVFRRGADFDPRVDNIVRVQARNLRQRLALPNEPNMAPCFQQEPKNQSRTPPAKDSNSPVSVSPGPSRACLAPSPARPLARSVPPPADPRVPFDTESPPTASNHQVYSR